MGGDRIAGVAALLEAAGVVCQVRAAGHDGSIAALSLAPARWLALTEDERGRLAASIKAHGFRYVALDVPSEGGNAGEER